METSGFFLFKCTTLNYICRQFMKPRVLINSKQFELTLTRLCFELIENHNHFTETVILGIQPRGTLLSRRIFEQLSRVNSNHIDYGELDITFYRDDFRRRREPLAANKTTINFEIENKKVILIDDVLYTGRTIRAAMDALMDYGRPKSVELLVLIDRRFSRHLPIQPDYIGKTVDAIESERVKVEWKETDKTDQVLLHKLNDKNE